MQTKIGTELRLVVRLTDSSTGAPVPLMPSNAVQVTVLRADGTCETLTPSGGMWLEVTTDNFAGTGTYVLLLPASTTTVAGELSYIIKVPTCSVVFGDVEVVAHSAEETYANTRELHAATFGKMSINTSTKRMTLFELDGITVLATFELQDESGVPSALRPFRRIPV